MTATAAGGATRPWQIIALCGFVALLDGFDTQAIAYVAPLVAADLAIDPARMGAVFSSGLLGLMVGAILGGIAAGRVGTRAVILIATLAFGAMALLTPLATGFASLSTIRFLTGLGLGAAMPNLIAVTSNVAPDRHRATIISLMFCGFPLGSTLGGVIAAAVAPTLGWQSLFIIGGLLPLLTAVFIWRILPDDRRTQQASGNIRARPRELFEGGLALPTLLLWLAFFMNLLLMYFLVNWMPSILAATGITLSRSILTTAVFNLGGIAGGLLLGILVDRRRSALPLAAAFLLAAAGIWAFAGLASALLTFLLSFLIGGVVVGGQIAMNAVAALTYRSELRATGVGFALGIGRMGSLIGPTVGGLLVAGGWTTGDLLRLSVVPALVTALALATLVRFSAASRQRQ